MAKRIAGFTATVACFLPTTHSESIQTLSHFKLQPCAWIQINFFSLVCLHSAPHYDKFISESWRICLRFIKKENTDSRTLLLWHLKFNFRSSHLSHLINYDRSLDLYWSPPPVVSSADWTHYSAGCYFHFMTWFIKNMEWSEHFPEHTVCFHISRISNGMIKQQSCWHLLHCSTHSSPINSTQCSSTLPELFSESAIDYTFFLQTEETLAHSCPSTPHTA